MERIKCKKRSIDVLNFDINNKVMNDCRNNGTAIINSDVVYGDDDDDDCDEIPETQQLKIPRKSLNPLTFVTNQINNKIMDTINKSPIKNPMQKQSFQTAAPAVTRAAPAIESASSTITTTTDLFDEINFDDFEFDEAFEKENIEITKPTVTYNLKLNTWKRCIIESITRDPKTYDQILIIYEITPSSPSPSKEHNKGICRLQGAWCHSKLHENDLISLYGIWDELKQCYCINNGNGFVIIKPDYLIAGTSIVGSLFCQRKGVLSTIYRGVDGANKIMTIGSIVHDLLQIVLKRKVTTSIEIHKIIDDILCNSNTIYDLYASEMSLEEARKEIEQYVDNIINFINEYIIGNPIEKTDKTLFNGKIDSIQDIEENLWIPQMGIQGKIDVSVKCRPRNTFFDASSKYMPLELKTGRSSYSAEHKGQLILYQMMLNEIGESVDSGLLLYLKEGTMKEIPSARNEQRDIIMLRNELVYYLTKNIRGKPTDTEDNVNGGVPKLIDMPIELPEPINHFACKTCPYNIICCSYLNHQNGMTKLSAQHPLQQINASVTKHLSKSHIDYFIHWTGLLTVEEQEQRKGNQLKNVWTVLPELREKQGQTINNLILIESIYDPMENKYLHRFKKADKLTCSPPIKQSSIGTGNDHNSTNFLFCGLTIGEYIIVSIKQRLAIAMGHVRALNETEITLILERNLCDRYFNHTFILDKYESMMSSSRFNMTNIACLLDDNEQSDRLRQSIIDLKQPTFTNKLPKIISIQGAHILSTLNGAQRNAALRALTANDYLLIKGLPGTGKTKTIIAIVRLFQLMNKSVLITSHTHSAVDNVLIKLLELKIKFLRIGNSCAKIMPELHSHCEISLMNDCKTPDDIKEFYNQYMIVGVTCLGAAHTMLAQRKFDVCIVDESTQVLQCTVLRPLLSAHKFILVGDPEQLPPLVRSKQARSLGADESLFARLDRDDNTTAVLTHQYRMNKTITKLANTLTYNGALICANDDIAMATLHLSNAQEITKQYAKDKWLLKTLSSHLDQSVILLDTGNTHLNNIEFINQTKNNDLKSLSSSSASNRIADGQQTNERIYVNYYEAAIVLYLIDAILKSNVKPSSIGLIASYRSQVDLLKYIMKKFQTKYEDIEQIEVNTVDQYQGRDKEIIIYSCTKSLNDKITTKNDLEILEDQRRLTVAITRSKYKLIIIGDQLTLVNYGPFKKIFENLSRMSKLQLINGQYGFNWDQILSQLQTIID